MVNGIWQHVIVTYDGSRIKGYLNGVYKRSITVPGTIATSSTSLYVGWHNSTPYFRGCMDNVRIYSHALATAERTADMTGDTFAAAPLTIVQDGTPATAIIIPDVATAVVQNAASELRDSIQKATGATLGIYSESGKPTVMAD